MMIGFFEFADCALKIIVPSFGGGKISQHDRKFVMIATLDGVIGNLLKQESIILKKSSGRR